MILKNKPLDFDHPQKLYPSKICTYAVYSFYFVLVAYSSNVLLLCGFELKHLLTHSNLHSCGACNKI